ncbi:MAG: cyclic nucleotide-binding domain-containing protein [Candidatus Latescibacteria bacterium]|jgi:CRP/FNR family transcriptional regulator, cyclic AMP receptor protein|nr:cyclic nucleotide-binding domain-containing protein [Candidatus Latescibacterota bacterium]
MSKQNYRSGVDRRQELSSVKTERRLGLERRSLLIDPDKTTGRLRIVPFFAGLSTEQLGKLLPLCKKKKFEEDDYIFQIGEESNELLMMIGGKVKLIFANGGESPAITPSGVIGDMGLFTGKARAASVIAVTSTTVLSFGRDELFGLFSEEMEMCKIIQMNVIRHLCDKLQSGIIAEEESRGARQLYII